MKKRVLLLLMVLFVVKASPLTAQELDSIQLVQEVERLRAALKAKDDSISDLTRYVQQTDPLVKKQLSQMTALVDSWWLKKTYAQVDEKSLQDELLLFEAVDSRPEKVDAAYKKLLSFFGDFLVYQGGIEAVNNAYDPERVPGTLQAVFELYQREKDPVRKKEVEVVLEQLRDYKYTVIYFQEDIIGTIDERLQDYIDDGTSATAWEQVKIFLDSGDEGQIEQYLTKIPWLGEQYRLYVEQLKKDPYAPNPARETIMSLKP